MRGGFERLINAAALLVCTLVMAALVLPAIAAQRGKARSIACGTNLRMIGLANHNYHAAYKKLPQGCGGTNSEDDAPELSNQGRLGPLVAITPFVEQQALWEMISNPYMNPETKQRFPPMGPVPWYDETVYLPWSQSPPTYSCPERDADRPADEPKIVFTLQSEGGLGVMSNYVACYGDGTDRVGSTLDPKSIESQRHARAAKRGLFESGRVIKFRDCLDGLSHTLMYSETRSMLKGQPGLAGIAKDVKGLSFDPSLCLAAAKDEDTKWWPFGRGSRWSDGALIISGFQAVLPPNSPSCTSDRGFGTDDVVASASSYHAGGVHTLMADGRVSFVSETIDAGDPSLPGVSIGNGFRDPGTRSPYGLWGAMGTRAAKETINIPEPPPSIEHLVFDRRQTNSGEKPSYTHWSDRTGKISLRARMVRIIDKKTIELEDSRGVLHRVPLNTLRDKDIYRAVEADLSAELGTP